MKAFILAALLLLSSCGSTVVNQAKVSLSDSVEKHSKEFLKKQASRDIDEYEYARLKCDQEAGELSLKIRDGFDKVLKAERETEGIGYKSVASDIVMLGCDLLIKKAIVIAVGDKFDDYPCALKMFGNGLEKASGKLCPYIKSKME